MNGIFGIPYFLKTDVWVVAHKGKVIPLLPHKNYKVIQLWHSSGGIKGVAHRKEDFDMFDAWCVSSEYAKKRHTELWNAPQEKIYVTGSARTDLLNNYLKTKKETLLAEIKVDSRKKIVLLAPTFDSGIFPWENKYEEFEKLCKFCRENDLSLILRLHPYANVNRDRIRKIVSKFENVYWLDMSNEPEEMKLLTIADILITDWSSIHAEYTLTKRPIIYLEVDKKYFTEERGKPLLPPEYRTGEIVRDTSELYKALKVVLAKGNRYKKQQEELSKKIFGVKNEKSSERAVCVIEEILNGK